MQEFERFDHLQRLANNDEIYMVWKNSYDYFEAKAQKILRWCPRKMRNILQGYVDCGRMMMQRMVNLACEKMNFPDE